jgi:hypothetical protein
MKVTKTEEWQDAVKDHIDKLDEDDKRHFAHMVIYDIALWTGYNVYEMVGILECVKVELLESFKSVEDDD